MGLTDSIKQFFGGSKRRRRRRGGATQLERNKKTHGGELEKGTLAMATKGFGQLVQTGGTRRRRRRKSYNH